ncbi:MAG TPA: hypothetical protein VGO06_27910 [Bosea sp. (in: a-proteobacteria)]|uniref:hypothetical protein n=1 Tax=Bosea sp. (in: a-proteobacteria) TaxID=1871050 RepID=UPI002E0E226E|nr:hypothetical protein [Bosea sp. (in: a-proteobacteria)]
MLAKAVEDEKERRKTVALNLIIEAVGDGAKEGVHFGNEDAEQFADMLLRFMAAARDGAAKQNLRLMARLIVGLKRDSTFEADQFQRWATILKDMTALEIEIVAECYRVLKKGGVIDRPWAEVMEALSTNHDRNDIRQSAAALMRTGLLVPESLMSGISYEPTSSVLQLGELAELDSAAST